MGILFAMIAIILPAYAIIMQNKRHVKRPYIFSVGSFGCLSATLCIMLMSIKSRVLSSDWGGIEDTIGALIMMAVVFSVFIILLNILMLGLYCEK